MGNARGKVGSALGTVAGRDTGERAGDRCGAGHGGARWATLRGGTRWIALWRNLKEKWGKYEKTIIKTHEINPRGPNTPQEAPREPPGSPK